MFYLYNEPTNAKLIYNLLYCSLLHCPYMFRCYCVIFRELVVGTCWVIYISIWMQYWWYTVKVHSKILM